MPPIKKLPMFSDCVEDTIDMPEVTEECDACDQFLYELERMHSELDSLRAFIISRTRPMQGASASSAGEEGVVPQPLAGEQDLFLKGDGTWAVVPGMTPINPATQVPFMDGTGAVGVSAKYAREDHRHPSDTSKQDVLVSGTNIKTVNGNSLLGSGDIPISGGGTPSSTMPVMDGAGTAGAATEYARGDHQHPSDTSKADKATTLAGYGITDAYTKTETDNALANKVDKVAGKGLSTNDFTTTLKDKLDGIAAGAEVNVNADWNANSGDAQILNKPSIPSPSSTTPAMDGTAATGSETAYARGDHVHPSDTSKLDLSGGEMSGDIDMMDSQIKFRGGIYGAVFGQANGARVYPLATPTQDYDASTKKYVDDHTTTWYGISNTESTTAEKVVECDGFVYKEGSIIVVSFTTGSTEATPTLNVNGIGSKNIHVGGSTPNGTANTLKWSAGTQLVFMCHDNAYRFLTAQGAGTTTLPQGAGVWYGTSSTAATTAAKTTAVTNFRLTKGAIVNITFTTANTKADAALTLNVNSTGAKTIYVNNAATSATNSLLWSAGETLTFVYSGSYYYFVGKSGSNIGTVVEASVGTSGTTAIPTGTVTNVATISLTPGTWMVHGRCSFNTGGTAAAYRGCYIGSSATGMQYGAQQQAGSSSGNSMVNAMAIVTLSSTSTIYLNAVQGSGGNLNLVNSQTFIKAVRVA